MDQLARQLSADAWHRYRMLEGSKGPLVADFAAMRAVATRDGLPGPAVWVLFRRAVRDPADTADPPELKVYLSNAPADTPLAELVGVSGGGCAGRSSPVSKKAKESWAWTTTSCASGAAGTTSTTI